MATVRKSVRYMVNVMQKRPGRSRYAEFNEPHIELIAFDRSILYRRATEESVDATANS